MGRTLSNTMLNLGMQATVDEALYQVILCSFLAYYIVYKLTSL